MKAKALKAKGFDRKFDKGEDVSRFLDRSRARRPAHEQRRVNVDFPLWMVHSLDGEAKRLGVTRQSVIKLWLAERLKNAPPSDITCHSGASAYAMEAGTC